MTRKSSALKIVRAAPSPDDTAIRLANGASAAAEGNAIVIRDPQGSIVVRYDAADGTATIAAPRGDLRLAAPSGKIVLDAGSDLELRAEKRTTLRSGELAVDVGHAALRSRMTELFSDAVELTASGLAMGVGRIQVSAERVLTKARDVYHEVEGVVDTKAGRLRSIVRGASQLKSESTSIVSAKDTYIDGKRVLLG